MNAFANRHGAALAPASAPPAAAAASTRAAGMFSNLTTPAGATTPGETETKAPRPKAQFWVNIGYPIEVQDAAGQVERKFVSTPMGMPLDTQEKIAITGKNVNYIAFCTARNTLLDDLIEQAGPLEPGQEVEFPIGNTGLFLQFRRVDVAGAAPVIDAANNPFIKKMNLMAA